MNVQERSAVRPNWKLLWGFVAGLGTQVFFGYTAVCLFFFLKDGGSPGSEFRPLWNCFLALQFAIPHSLLLWPPASKVLQKWIPKAFYGCFYCLVTCGSLILLFNGWTTSPFAVWSLTGYSAAIVRLMFFLSWGGLIYSLSLTGLGYQTGLTQWWAWLWHLALPRRGVPDKGAYQWIRHPVYFCFLGLIWFTPNMTLDHAILTGIWTVYLLVGSHLKDERLAFYLGDDYRQYQKRVPGFPWSVVRFPGLEVTEEVAPPESPVAWQAKSTTPAPVEKAA